MARFMYARGYVSGLLGFACAGLAAAQTVPFPNGDYSSGLTGWVVEEQPPTDSEFRIQTSYCDGDSSCGAVDGYSTAGTGVIRVRGPDIDLEDQGVDPINTALHTLTVTMRIARISGSSTNCLNTASWSVGAVWGDITNTELSRGFCAPIATGDLNGGTGLYDYSTISCTIPRETGAFHISPLLKVEMTNTSSCVRAVDNWQLVIGEGSGGGDEEAPWDDFVGTGPDTAELDDIGDIFDGLQDFACGVGPDISKMKKAGGGSSLGAIVKAVVNVYAGQLIAVQQQAEQLCLGNAQVDLLGAIGAEQAQTNDALSDPDPYTELSDPIPWADASYGDFTTRVDNAFSVSAPYDDDTVTALNRQNDILKFQTKLAAAQYERIYGKVDDKGASLAYDGPLMTEEAIEGDFSARIAEDDYGQAKAYIGGAAEEPDYKSALRDDLAAEAIDPDGACLATNLEAPPASIETVDDALAVIKHNAIAKLSASEVGTLACSLVSMPPIDSSSICFGSPFEQGGALCIKGPQAPAPFSIFWLALPAIVLFGAGILVLRMFI